MKHSNHGILIWSLSLPKGRKKDYSPSTPPSSLAKRRVERVLRYIPFDRLRDRKCNVWKVLCLFTLRQAQGPKMQHVESVSLFTLRQAQGPLSLR